MAFCWQKNGRFKFFGKSFFKFILQIFEQFVTKPSIKDYFLTKKRAIMTSKPIRISTENNLLIESTATFLGLKVSNFANIVIRIGLEEIQKNGIKIPKIEENIAPIDGGEILKEAEIAASKGEQSLVEYLQKLTPKEEQTIKYSIKILRKKAEEAEVQKLILERKACIKIGDKKCLAGMDDFNLWFNSLPKIMKKMLTVQFKSWTKDAKNSDRALKLFGYRPDVRLFKIGAKKHPKKIIKKEVA